MVIFIKITIKIILSYLWNYEMPVMFENIKNVYNTIFFKNVFKSFKKLRKNFKFRKQYKTFETNETYKNMSNSIWYLSFRGF